MAMHDNTWPAASSLRMASTSISSRRQRTVACFANALASGLLPARQSARLSLSAIGALDKNIDVQLADKTSIVGEGWEDKPKAVAARRSTTPLAGR